MIGIVVALLLVGAGVWFSPRISEALPGLLSSGSDAETKDSQIITSVAREQQVVLLGLGIQGIIERNDSSEFLGMSVPGSNRATFLQYSFKAKLGIEGKRVEVTRTGDNSFTVSIPKFEFIGFDNPTFKLAAESNGALSWVTPEIDTTEMISGILNDSTEETYIADNEDALKDQAKMFYTNIITAIEPTAQVDFEFTS